MGGGDNQWRGAEKMQQHRVFPEDGESAGGRAHAALHVRGAVLLGQADHREPPQESRAAADHDGGEWLGHSGLQGHTENQARMLPQAQADWQPLEWRDRPARGAAQTAAAGHCQVISDSEFQVGRQRQFPRLHGQSVFRV